MKSSSNPLRRRERSLLKKGEDKNEEGAEEVRKGAFLGTSSSLRRRERGLLKKEEDEDEDVEEGAEEVNEGAFLGTCTSTLLKKGEDGDEDAEEGGAEEVLKSAFPVTSSSLVCLRRFWTRRLSLGRKFAMPERVVSTMLRRDRRRTRPPPAGLSTRCFRGLGALGAWFSWPACPASTGGAFLSRWNLPGCGAPGRAFPGTSRNSCGGCGLLLPPTLLWWWTEVTLVVRGGVEYVEL